MRLSELIWKPDMKFINGSNREDLEKIPKTSLKMRNVLVEESPCHESIQATEKVKSNPEVNPSKEGTMRGVQ